MIPDAVFAGTGSVLAVVYLVLGGMMLVAARTRWRQWPVTAYIALAGPYIAAGVIFAHRAGWRLGNPPGEIFDRNGVGSLAISWVAIVFAVALIQRLWSGTLLTEQDRERIAR